MSPQVLAASDAGAGLEPWWTYVTYSIPGVGEAMANVGTGNLVVHATDVDIPGRGLDLAFDRTYNSQSLHDAAGDDGSEQSIFGNGWTNTYDAHMVVRYNGQTVTAISIYDGAGARCDYTPQTNGSWLPCTGEHAQLQVDLQNGGCSYWWIQKDGTALWFHTPFQSCVNQPATVGHLYAIYGRNTNNSITLSYSFVPNQPQTAENITEIDVNHSNGQSLKMAFALADNTGPNELVTLTRPDNSFLVYDYDINGDLTEVDRPAGNGSSLVPETYSASHPMQFVCSPRASLSSLTDGACLNFDYNSNVTLMDWKLDAALNPDPGDSHGYIQPSQPHGYQTGIYKANFVYGSGTGCTTSYAGTTTFCDKDGHSTIWTVGAASQVTQTQAFTGPSSSLITTQTWDGNNNLVATTDPMGNETDYTYDTNGNRVAVGFPSVSDMLVNGNPATFRPTFLFSYDSTTNNLLSACDPVYTNTLGKNWTSSLSGDSLCPITPGSATSPAATVYQYQTEAAEPYGFLQYAYTPMGYRYTLSYNQTAQNGDFGLATQIQGQQFSENDGGAAIQPVANYTYDGFGNVATYGNGKGQWTYTYDSLNRPTVANDPTNVNSYVCYNPDNSIQSATTAHQYQLDGRACGLSSPNYTYDADGDSISDWRAYTAGQTTRTFDGLDRLVEVQVPADANIDSNQIGTWRYFYDITGLGASANLSIGSTNGVAAYGNLFKTQRCLGTSQCTLQDVNGNAFDPLDRTTARYQYAPTYPGVASPNPSPGAEPGPLQTWTYTFDGVHSLGLQTGSQDPLGISTTYNYDSMDRMYSKAFSDSTPTVGFKYDPGSRIAQLSSTVGTEAYTYSADGWLQGYAESGGIHDPETLTYAAYANGWRKSLTVQDTAANFNETFKYAYRVDGPRRTLNVGSNTFSWTYDNAGRETSQTDPYAQQSPLPNIPSAIWPGSNPPTPEYSNGITIGSQTLNYDNTGLLSNMTLASGVTYTGIQHNAHGSVTAFGVNVPGFQWVQNSQNVLDSFVTGVNYGYDIRREYNQLQETSPSVTPSPGGYVTVQQTQVFDGHPITCDVTSPTNCSQPSGVLIDGKTGGVYALPPIASPPPGCTGYNAISYDADGRQFTTIGVNSGFGCGGNVVTDQRSYDAENHTATMQNSNGQTSFTWNPSGRMSTATLNPVGQSTTYTMHWDGASLLFVTDGSDKTDQVNIEHLATKGGKNATLVVYDRDFSGAVVESHTSTADSGTSVGQDYFNPYSPIGKLGLPTIMGSYPGAGSMPSQPLVGMQRTDGYLLAGLSFQGIRAYDSTTQQWTTPDGYAGSDDDPMSQMAYQWNRNNPLDNVDPSGYFSASFQTNPIDCPGGVIPGVCQPYAIPYTTGSNSSGSELKTIKTVTAHRGHACSVGGSPSPPTLPPGYTWSAEYAAGLANVLNPEAAKKLLTGQGRFNYQRFGGQYRHAGNFGIGVYAEAARLPESMVEGAFIAVGSGALKVDSEPHHLTEEQIQQDIEWGQQGREWARTHCH